MHNYDDKMMNRASMSEKTTLVMRSIKDLLVERGHADLLLSSKDTPLRQAAAAAADRASLKHEPQMQMPRTGSTPKEENSFAQRLADRFFG